MSENDRKLLADILRAARRVVEFDVKSEVDELERCIDRYDLRAEDPIK